MNSLSVVGSATVTNTLTTGSLVTTGNLNVTGNATLANSMTVPTLTASTATVTNLTANTTLTVAGAVSMANNLTVGGVTTLNNTTNVGGNMFVTGDFTATNAKMTSSTYLTGGTPIVNVGGFAAITSSSTITASQLGKGQIAYTGSGSATLTLPTAAQLNSSLARSIGDSWTVIIFNNSAFTVTLAQSSDTTVTVSGPTSIYAGVGRECVVVMTGATAYKVYVIGNDYTALNASSLAVSGNATVGGTITITGAANLNGGLSIGGVNKPLFGDSLTFDSGVMSGYVNAPTNNNLGTSGAPLAGGVVTIDFGVCTNPIITLDNTNAALTINIAGAGGSMPSNSIGRKFLIVIIDNSTVPNRALTWDSRFVWPGGTAPTTTSTMYSVVNVSIIQTSSGTGVCLANWQYQGGAVSGGGGGSSWAIAGFTLSRLNPDSTTRLLTDSSNNTIMIGDIRVLTTGYLAVTTPPLSNFAVAGTGYGAAISISPDGTYKAVSAPTIMNPVTKTATGAVYIYKMTSNTWQLVQTVFPTNTTLNYGASLVMNNSTLVVGAPAETSGNAIYHGNVYVYTLTNGQFVYKTALVPTPANTVGRYGSTFGPYAGYGAYLDITGTAAGVQTIAVACSGKTAGTAQVDVVIWELVGLTWTQVLRWTRPWTTEQGNVFCAGVTLHTLGLRKTVSFAVSGILRSNISMLTSSRSGATWANAITDTYQSSDATTNDNGAIVGWTDASGVSYAVKAGGNSKPWSTSLQGGDYGNYLVPYSGNSKMSGGYIDSNIATQSAFFCWGSSNDPGNEGRSYFNTACWGNEFMGGRYGGLDFLYGVSGTGGLRTGNLLSTYNAFASNRDVVVIQDSVVDIYGNMYVLFITLPRDKWLLNFDGTQSAYQLVDKVTTGTSALYPRLCLASWDASGMVRFGNVVQNAGTYGVYLSSGWDVRMGLILGRMYIDKFGYITVFFSNANIQGVTSTWYSASSSNGTITISPPSAYRYISTTRWYGYNASGSAVNGDIVSSIASVYSGSFDVFPNGVVPGGQSNYGDLAGNVPLPLMTTHYNATTDTTILICQQNRASTGVYPTCSTSIYSTGSGTSVMTGYNVSASSSISVIIWTGGTYVIGKIVCSVNVQNVYGPCSLVDTVPNLEWTKLYILAANLQNATNTNTNISGVSNSVALPTMGTGNTTCNIVFEIDISGATPTLYDLRRSMYYLTTIAAHGVGTLSGLKLAVSSGTPSGSTTKYVHVLLHSEGGNTSGGTPINTTQISASIFTASLATPTANVTASLHPGGASISAAANYFVVTTDVGTNNQYIAQICTPGNSISTTRRISPLILNNSYGFIDLIWPTDGYYQPNTNFNFPYLNGTLSGIAKPHPISNHTGYNEIPVYRIAWSSLVTIDSTAPITLFRRYANVTSPTGSTVWCGGCINMLMQCTTNQGAQPDGPYTVIAFGYFGNISLATLGFSEGFNTDIFFTYAPYTADSGGPSCIGVIIMNNLGHITQGGTVVQLNNTGTYVTSQSANATPNRLVLQGITATTDNEFAICFRYIRCLSSGAVIQPVYCNNANGSGSTRLPGLLSGSAYRDATNDCWLAHAYTRIKLNSATTSTLTDCYELCTHIIANAYQNTTTNISSTFLLGGGSTAHSYNSAAPNDNTYYSGTQAFLTINTTKNCMAYAGGALLVNVHAQYPTASPITVLGAYAAFYIRGSTSTYFTSMISSSVGQPTASVDAAYHVSVFDFIFRIDIVSTPVFTVHFTYGSYNTLTDGYPNHCECTSSSALIQDINNSAIIYAATPVNSTNPGYYTIQSTTGTMTSYQNPSTGNISGVGANTRHWTSNTGLINITVSPTLMSINTTTAVARPYISNFTGTVYNSTTAPPSAFMMSYSPGWFSTFVKGTSTTCYALFSGSFYTTNNLGTNFVTLTRLNGGSVTAHGILLASPTGYTDNWYQYPSAMTSDIANNTLYFGIMMPSGRTFPIYSPDAAASASALPTPVATLITPGWLDAGSTTWIPYVFVLNLSTGAYIRNFKLFDIVPPGVSSYDSVCGGCGTPRYLSQATSGGIAPIDITIAGSMNANVMWTMSVNGKNLIVTQFLYNTYNQRSNQNVYLCSALTGSTTNISTPINSSPSISNHPNVVGIPHIHVYPILDPNSIIIQATQASGVGVTVNLNTSTTRLQFINTLTSTLKNIWPKGDSYTADFINDGKSIGYNPTTGNVIVGGANKALTLNVTATNVAVPIVTTKIGNLYTSTASDVTYGNAVAISSSTNLKSAIVAIGQPNYTVPSTSLKVGGVNDYISTTTVIAPTVTTSQPKYGYSVAMSGSGNYCVVGAPTIATAYVYARTGNTWALADTLTGGSGTTQFGFSVALSFNAEIIVVGDKGFTNNGVANSGAVFVFKYNTGLWTGNMITLRDSSTGTLNQFFGQAIAVSGNGLVVVVGAPGATVTGANAGKVFVFSVSTSVSNWASVTSGYAVYADSTLANAAYGSAVACDWAGSLILAGAPGETVSAITNAGLIRRLSSLAAGAQTGTAVTGPTAVINAAFGSSIACTSSITAANNATYIVVSAPGVVNGVFLASYTSPTVGTFSAASTGSTYSTALALASNYNTASPNIPLTVAGVPLSTGSIDSFYTNTSLSSTKLITTTVGTSGGFGGYSLSISADGAYMIVGQPTLPDANSNANVGGIQIYSMTPPAPTSLVNCPQLNTIYSSTAVNYGFSVAINGDATVAVVGAPDANPSPGPAGGGVAYVYTRTGDTWQLYETLQGDTNSISHGCAVAISDDGTVIAVGDKDYINNAVAGSGAVWVYKYSALSWASNSCILKEGTAGVSGQNLGYSVAISGNGTAIVIGAPGFTNTGAGAGKVFVFTTASQSTWASATSGYAFYTDYTLAGAAYGTAVACDWTGALAIASAPGATVSATTLAGEIRILTTPFVAGLRTGTAMTGPTAVASARFGSKIQCTSSTNASNGTFITATATGVTNGLFMATLSGTWSAFTTVRPTSGATYSGGLAIASTYAKGAPFNPYVYAGAPAQGSFGTVYGYYNASGTPTFTGTATTTYTGDNVTSFGTAIAVSSSGLYVVVGETNASDSVGDANVGRVKFFNTTTNDTSLQILTGGTLTVSSVGVPASISIAAGSSYLGKWNSSGVAQWTAQSTVTLVDSSTDSSNAVYAVGYYVPSAAPTIYSANSVLLSTTIATSSNPYAGILLRYSSAGAASSNTTLLWPTGSNPNAWCKFTTCLSSGAGVMVGGVVNNCSAQIQQDGLTLPGTTITPPSIISTVTASDINQCAVISLITSGGAAVWYSTITSSTPSISITPRYITSVGLVVVDVLNPSGLGAIISTVQGGVTYATLPISSYSTVLAFKLDPSAGTWNSSFGVVIGASPASTFINVPGCNAIGAVGYNVAVNYINGGTRGDVSTPSITGGTLDIFTSGSSTRLPITSTYNNTAAVVIMSSAGVVNNVTMFATVHNPLTASNALTLQSTTLTLGLNIGGSKTTVTNYGNIYPTYTIGRFVSSASGAPMSAVNEFHCFVMSLTGQLQNVVQVADSDNYNGVRGVVTTNTDASISILAEFASGDATAGTKKIRVISNTSAITSAESIIPSGTVPTFTTALMKSALGALTFVV